MVMTTRHLVVRNDDAAAIGKFVVIVFEVAEVLAVDFIGGFDFDATLRITDDKVNLLATIGMPITELFVVVTISEVGS